MADRRRLPPLNSLRAFEAVARHLSFKEAAAELNVTPAALSQQVRHLEEFVGRPLFERRSRALDLTDAGETALPLLTKAFDQLADAVEAILTDEDEHNLTVSVAPSFAAKWLVPRLDRFRREQPEIEVRIDATDRFADFRRDRVDVAVRYGRGDYGDLSSVWLIKEVAFPVASPRLVEMGPPLGVPADLAAHTLLHTEWRMEREAMPTWRMWLRAAGALEVDAERGPRFSADSLAVQAAIEGHGVALASSALVADDLKAGRLIRPFPPSGAEASVFSYYLVYPEAKGRLAKVQAFRDWIVKEIKDTPT